MIYSQLIWKTNINVASYGNYILIFVFTFWFSQGSSSPQVTTKATPITTTTDDTPDFDRTKVSLDIPDRLFSTSFSTVTNVSKIFGDFLMVSFSSLLAKLLYSKLCQVEIQSSRFIDTFSKVLPSWITYIHLKICIF